MRHLILISLCLAAVASAHAQDATPVKQTPDSQPSKQTVYIDPNSGETITVTGTDTLARWAGGKTTAGKYTVEGGRMQVVYTLTSESGYPRTVRHTYNVVTDGLQDDEYGQVLMSDTKRAEGLMEKNMLSNEKQIALACRLYASDNDGKFPARLYDLMPTYLQDEKLFISPLSTKKEAMGYDYLGAGGTDSDDPKKILLRSRDTTPDGRRIVVYWDGSGEIVADK